MRKLAKIVGLLMMTLCTVFAIAACGASEISVDSNNLPRVLYVEGQDLDLAGGILNVGSGDSVKQIALGDKDVKVSGYDKTKIGEQTLTVEYDGGTCELKVTVIPRISVSGFEANYFVGETFDKSKGTLRIANDDATTFDVPMSAETVSVENFNSAAAADAVQVTARYQSGEKNYTGTFNVKIHNVSSSSFTLPSNRTYKSHHTELDLAGGFITLNNASGDLTRYRAITSDMVTGFDPALATEENDNSNPLSQTLTISYLGQTKTYTVSITYSDVSRIKARVAELNKIVWPEGELPTVTATLGEQALEAMDMYLGLSFEDANYITEEEQNTIARAASVYGYDKWYSAFDDYYMMIQPTMLGTSLTLRICDPEDYPIYKAAYTQLKDDTAFKNLTALLSDVKKEFQNLVVYTPSAGEGVVVSKYLQPVCTLAVLEENIYEIDMMVGLYEILKDVPTDWTETSVLTMTNVAFDDAINLITSYTGDFFVFPDGVTYLRADYFDILYAYYCADKNFSRTAFDAISQCGHPDIFDELYDYIAYAWDKMVDMNSMYDAIIHNGEIDFDQLAILADASYFYYYFNGAVAVEEEILNGPSKTYKKLYELFELEGFTTSGTVTFPDLMFNLRYATFGYYYLQGSMLGDAGFDRVFRQSVNLTSALIMANSNADYYEGDSFSLVKFLEGDAQNNVVGYGDDILALFNDFIDLSPTQQYGVLAAAGTYYAALPLPEYMFIGIGSGGGYNTNFDLLLNFFLIMNLPTGNLYTEDMEAEEIPTNAYVLAGDLIFAIENYARRYMSTGEEDNTYLTRFLAQMEEVQTGYAELSTAITTAESLLAAAETDAEIKEARDNLELAQENKAKFDEYLGTAYQKYLAIYNLYQQDGSMGEAPALSADAEELFAELTETLEVALKCIRLLTPDSQNYYFPVYMATVSIFERAEAISEDILALAATDVDVYNAYYHYELPMLAEWGCTFDQVMLIVRDTCNYILTDRVWLWEDYVAAGSEVEQFMILASDLFIPYINSFSNIVEEGDPNQDVVVATYDDDAMAALLTMFRGLSVEQKRVIYEIEGVGFNFYVDLLDSYFTSKFPNEADENVLAVATLMGSMECDYVMYMAYPKDSYNNGVTTKDAFIDSWEAIAEAYKALTPEEKAAFDALTALKDMYDYYLAEYTEITEA